MKTILAFGASNSRNSINKTLAVFAAGHFENAKINVLDLNDFEMPIFSIDRENKNGIHKLAYQFKKQIKEADGIIISFAEHNGAYSAAFKNIYDWVSRISSDVWEGKPMFMMATSPGGHGGKTVLDMAYNRFKRSNRNTIEVFSLPKFKKNYSEENGIVDSDFFTAFYKRFTAFKEAVLLQDKVEII